MKKSELIERLNDIEGDPEVFVYADHGQDYERVCDVEEEICLQGDIKHPDDIDPEDLEYCEDVICIYG